MMLSLRLKLTYGFVGMLSLLLVVGGLGILLLNNYSETLETILHENYDSVLYSQKMMGAMDALDDQAQRAFWMDEQVRPSPSIDTLYRNFQSALDAETKNLTLPGERQLVESLTQKWADYQKNYSRFISEFARDDLHRADYESEIRAASAEIKANAQSIVDLNMSNTLSVDGRIKVKADAARRMMILLLVSGTVFAVALIAFSTRSILRPLQMVTESARAIQNDNLDLLLPIGARDEIGQLAEAFNGMTTRLREFRRYNRAQFVSVQKTTQLALNSFPEAVAVVGIDGNIELANERAVTRFQLLPGTDLSKHSHKALWIMFQEAFSTLAPVVSKGYEKAIQLFLNGDEFFFLPQAVPIIDDERLLNGVTLILIDVTNLRRIDEAKSDMLSVVSHELKTPLTSLRMATHLLLDERLGALEPKQIELLLTARDDAERLHRIIENLLDLGRMESGVDRIDLLPVAPEKLVREALALYTASAREQGVALLDSVAFPLPNVLVDSTRIPHVFYNLLDNALKHTTAGGSVTLSTYWNETEPQLIFRVQNSGRPIPEEFLARIFERFVRIPGQRGMQGVGLGLAIARDIVIGHGGRIWVENLPSGQGPCFSFTLNVEAPKPSTLG